MLHKSRSAELLQIISRTVGVDPADMEVWQGVAAVREGDRALDSREAVLLFRLIRAFRALPDGAHRLQALQYLETLAAAPLDTTQRS